jgi:hypothetical protein
MARRTQWKHGALKGVPQKHETPWQQREFMRGVPLLRRAPTPFADEADKRLVARMLDQRAKEHAKAKGA